MKAGDAGWISLLAVEVDEDFEVYLRPDADYTVKPKEDARMRDNLRRAFVERTSAGYELTLFHEHQWTRDRLAQGLSVVEVHELF